MKPSLFQRWCFRFLPGFGSWRKAFRSHVSASSQSTLSADDWRDLLVEKCETAVKESPHDPSAAQIQGAIQNVGWRSLLRAYPEAAIFLRAKGYMQSDSRHKAMLEAECKGLLETTGLARSDASAVLVELLGTRPDCQVRMPVVLVLESQESRAVLAELVLTLVDDGEADDGEAGNSTCSFVPSPAMRLWLGWDEELGILADDFKESLMEAFHQACVLAEWPESHHMMWSICFSHEYFPSRRLVGKSLQLPAALGLSLLAARNSSVKWKAAELDRDAIARLAPHSLLATGAFGLSTEHLEAKLDKFFKFIGNSTHHRRIFHAILLCDDENNVQHLRENPVKYEPASHPHTWLSPQAKTIPIAARSELGALLQAALVEKLIIETTGPGFQGRLAPPERASTASKPPHADQLEAWLNQEHKRILAIENDDTDQTAEALVLTISNPGWTVLGFWGENITADPLVVVQSLLAQTRRAVLIADPVHSDEAFLSDPVERELQMLAYCLESLPANSKTLMILTGVDFIEDHHGRSNLPARLAGMVSRSLSAKLRLILQSGSYSRVPKTAGVEFWDLTSGKTGEGTASNPSLFSARLLERNDRLDPLGWLVCARRLFRRQKTTWAALLGNTEYHRLNDAIQKSAAALHVLEEDLWQISMLTRRQILEQLCETKRGRRLAEAWHRRWGRRLFMLLHKPGSHDAGDMSATREARQHALDHVLGHLRLARLWEDYLKALQTPGFILEHLAETRGVRRLAKSLEKALNGKTCLPVNHAARPRVAELAFVIHPLADHVLKIDEMLALQCLHNSIMEQPEKGLRHWLGLFLGATDRLEKTSGAGWLRLLQTANGRSTLGHWPSHTLRKPAPMVAAAFCPELTKKDRPQVLTFSNDTVQLTKLGDTEPAFTAAIRRPGTKWSQKTLFSRIPIDVPGFINDQFAILVSTDHVSILDTKNKICHLDEIVFARKAISKVLHGRRLYLSVDSTPPRLEVYVVCDSEDEDRPLWIGFLRGITLSEGEILGGIHAKKNANGEPDEEAGRDIYRALAVSQDGSLVAVAKMDGVIDILSAPDLLLKHRLPARDRRVDSMIFSLDGRHLVAGGGMWTGHVEIWDLNECRATIARVHVNSIWSLGFVRHENEDYLVSGGFDRFVKVLSWPALLKLHREIEPNPARMESKNGMFDAINRTYHLHYLDLPSGVICSQRKTPDIVMSLSSIGSYLLAGAAGHPFAVYEMGELLRDPGSGITTAPVHTAAVASCGAHDHTPKFVWAGDDGSIYCRAGLDGAIQVHKTGLAEIRRIDISQDLIAAATINGVAVIGRHAAALSVIWNPSTGSRSDAVRMFKAGGRDLLVCGDCNGWLTVHDLFKHDILWSKQSHESMIRDLAVRVSDDGSKAWIASCGDDSRVLISVLRFTSVSATEPVEDKTIELSDPGLKEAKAHRGRVKSLLWCGKSLVSGGHEFIKVWRLENPESESPVFSAPQKLAGHVGEIWNLDYLPELNLLASGSQDQTVRVWRLETASLLASEPRKAPVVCVAWQKSREAGCGPILHVVDTGVSADPQCSSYELRGRR